MRDKELSDIRRDLRQIREMLEQQQRWLELWAGKTRDLLARRMRVDDEPDLHLMGEGDEGD